MFYRYSLPSKYRYKWRKLDVRFEQRWPPHSRFKRSAFHVVN